MHNPTTFREDYLMVNILDRFLTNTMAYWLIKLFLLAGVNIGLSLEGLEISKNCSPGFNLFVIVKAHQNCLKYQSINILQYSFAFSKIVMNLLPVAEG